MSPYNPLAALICLALAWGTAHAARGWAAAGTRADRNPAVDGLRGLMAFGVFLMHASIWFTWRQGGAWAVPPSALFTHLGQGGVTLFFMATAYLFGRRLMSARERPIDWKALFVGRVLRLWPAYLLAMAVLFSITALEGSEVTDGLAAYLAWLLFSIPGMPNLNGVPNTATILAGVTWTLPYEWMFYLGLPALAALMGRGISAPWILVGGFGIAWIGKSIAFHSLAIGMFAIGLLAAGVERRERARHWMAGPGGALLAVLAVGAAVWLSPQTAYRPLPVLLYGLAFTAVACGNTIGGLLTRPGLQTLGLSTYSLYLLHGALLHVALRHTPAALQPWLDEPIMYWGAMALLTPFLTLISLASYRWIEAPALRQRPRVLGWLRRISAGAGS